MIITPLAVPVAVGMNLTAIWHEPPGASELPQVVFVLSIMNTVGLLDVKLLSITEDPGEVPLVVFFTVMYLSALAVFTACDGKVVFAGEIPK